MERKETDYIDPNNGFCIKTKTYHSLRPKVTLPPTDQPLSVTDFTLSFLPSSTTSSTFLIDASTNRHLTFSHFVARFRSLAFSLQTRFSLSKHDVAFVLLPNSLHVPVVYFALLSLGVVVSPANPLNSVSDIEHQVRLSEPVIAFTTSRYASKLPRLRLGTVLVDSVEFESMLSHENSSIRPEKIEQCDPATILYSSGTTGRVKGVLMTHGSMIAAVAAHRDARLRSGGDRRAVALISLPLFHIFGLYVCVKGFASGVTSVIMERFDFEAMLRSVEKYRVSSMPVSPPIVVAMVKSQLTEKYDLSSLRQLECGGAPLAKEVSVRFQEKFRHAELTQGYALTESGAGSHMTRHETKRHGSVGRLGANMEAKIVNPTTGEALSPGQKGELWLRGPTIMKGYVGDDKATSKTLNSDGWLKTGDICYIDSEGYLFIVDRLKEMIKYKAYQVPPAELEHLLQSNPEIADAAVIPYPDEEVGQIPMAFVVRKLGSNITESQIMDFVAKQVAPYKKIRRVAFISCIPKSPSGKILRRELISQAITHGAARL